MSDLAVQTLFEAIYETTKLAEQQQCILDMLKRVREEDMKVHRNCNIAKTVGACTAVVGLPLTILTAGTGLVVVAAVMAGSGIVTTAGTTITELVITRKIVKKLKAHWQISTQLRTRLPELLNKVVQTCLLETSDSESFLSRSSTIGEIDEAAAAEALYSPSRYKSVAVTTASIGATVAGAIVASTVLAVVDVGKAINGWSKKAPKLSEIEKAIEDQERNLEAVTDIQIQLGDLLNIEKSALNWGFNPYCFNIAFIGRQGMGRSSLINALRKVGAGDLQAAKVGISHTTTEPKAYHYIVDGEPTLILGRPAILWDIPSPGTNETRWDSYWTTYMLPKFDLIVLVSNSSFIREEIALARTVQLCNKKVLFARTKIDLDLENIMADLGLSSVEERVMEVLNKSKEALFNELSKGGVSTRCREQSKLFFISCRAIAGSGRKFADEDAFTGALLRGGQFIFSEDNSCELSPPGRTASNSNSDDLTDDDLLIPIAQGSLELS